ncbi:MAG: hypothetical protein F7C38_03555 [Desulfurococcales archaeon]|nr:hypothetical protein [Desulfurococcales archaeon]
MKINREASYIPHIVIENLMEIHAALDPDTGHIICHYRPIGLTTIELAGEKYPGLRIGDCTTLVTDKEAVEKIIDESQPYPLTTMQSRERKDKHAFPLHEIGSVLSLLKESVSIEVRKTNDDRYIIFIINYNNYNYVIIVGKCESHDEEQDLLRV